MKRRNRPCYLRVSYRPLRAEEFGDPELVHFRHGTREPIRYRSIRQARERITDAAVCMDAYARGDYRIEIVTLDGEVIPVRMSSVYYVEGWNKDYTYHNCIAARLRRGETVII